MSRRRRPPVALNITPLVDVLLVLVVVLLVSMPSFVHRFSVDLPQVEATGAPQIRSAVRAELDSTGAWRIDDEPVDIASIPAKVKGKTVDLAVSASMTAQDLVRAVAFMEQSGARSVAILSTEY